MTIQSFSGAAGCGKTHQLMANLAVRLERHPLQAFQKVLALTFMHGSRRRLDDRLGGVALLRRQYECTTIDGFAWRIVSRWQALITKLEMGHPRVNDYEAVCQVAADLLSHDIVVRWIAATYPIVVVDEAQDLTPNRLRIVQSMATHVDLLIAADEFQCLIEELRPNPACEWLTAVGQDALLQQPRRTSDQNLLAAAGAIRSAQAPESNGLFKIYPTPKTALAASFVSNGIAWNRGGNRVAIITPTMGQFALDILTWVTTKTTGKGNGPYNIILEESETKLADAFIDGLALPDQATLAEAFTLMEGKPPAIAQDFVRWLEKQRRAKGKTHVHREEMEDMIRHSFSNQRRLNSRDGPGIRALTVHGAKNREFDLVIVLWPAAIRGNDEQKRRLLYNAVTRAKYQCIVLVQVPRAITSPPFAARRELA
ncbi:ATP-binding domain-containing protein [Pseudomonas sp. S3_H09]